MRWARARACPLSVQSGKMTREGERDENERGLSMTSGVEVDVMLSTSRCAQVRVATGCCCTIGVGGEREGEDGS